MDNSIVVTNAGFTCRQISQARGLTRHRIETPLPIAKIFVTVDYVRETTNCAKFDANNL